MITFLVSHVVCFVGFCWPMNQDHGRDVLFPEFTALLKYYLHGTLYSATTGMLLTN
jgi:hypothetical protein